MEKIVEQGLLYDFYGELLTEHQRRIYEDMVLNDLSPSEIAKEQGISRQSVHDLKKRCDKILEEYETKLQLVAKFMKIREMIRELDDLADTCAKTRDMALIDQIRKLSSHTLGGYEWLLKAYPTNCRIFSKTCGAKADFLKQM